MVYLRSLNAAVSPQQQQHQQEEEEIEKVQCGGILAILNQ